MADSDDFSRVYRAVAAGESAEELKRVIEECARGDEQRRAAAANQAAGEGNGETPLQAARRLLRGDLVGALVEAGADVGSIFEGKLTPIAVCILYGQPESLRALLRKGHDPSEKIPWHPLDGFSGDGHEFFCTPAHFCLAPLPISHWRGERQLGCLEVLVKDGRVDVNARDLRGETPLFWLARYPRAEEDDAEEEEAAANMLLAAGARASSGLFNSSGQSPLVVAALFNNPRFARYLIEEAGAPVDERCPQSGETALHRCCYGGWGSNTLAVLLDAGAEIDVQDNEGRTPLFVSVRYGQAAPVRLLLDRGASAEIAGDGGWTPLLVACSDRPWFSDDECWPVFQELLRRSSSTTRRAVPPADGFSAIDLLVEAFDDDDDDDDDDDPPSEEEKQQRQERRRWAIAELLVSGVPVLPQHAPVVLPIAAAVSARQQAELAARRAESRRWRAHETFVGLALDHQELREAVRGVEARRATVEALKQELRELGAGSQTDDGEDDESDGSDDDDESDEGDGSDGRDGSESGSGSGSSSGSGESQ